MRKTKIEYLNRTWNPLVMRCSKVSDGCVHCWHLRMCDRLAGRVVFPDQIRAAYAGEGLAVLVESRLEQPKSLLDPGVIGVQFMGDLFHNGVAWRDRELIFAVMESLQQHRFVVLTKRAGMMLEWYQYHHWPSNVWAGVTAENALWFDERVRFLLGMRGIRKFVSLEPLLEEIEYPTGVWRKLDLVIAGCESGPGRRRAEMGWFCSLAEQCAEAGVPFFLKQAEVDGRVVSAPQMEGSLTAAEAKHLILGSRSIRHHGRQA